MPTRQPTDLDDLLRSSRPTTVELSSAERDQLDQLVLAAWGDDRHREGGRRRWLGAALATGVVVSVGGVAAAATGHLDWVPWIDTAGRIETIDIEGGSCASAWRLARDAQLRERDPQAHAQIAAFLADFEPTQDALDAEADEIANGLVTVQPSGEQKTGEELWTATEIQVRAHQQLVGKAVGELATELGVADLVDLEAMVECDG